VPTGRLVNRHLSVRGFTVGKILFGNGELTVLDKRGIDEKVPDYVVVDQDWRNMAGVAVAFTAELAEEQRPYELEDSSNHILTELLDPDNHFKSVDLPVYRPERMEAIEAPVHVDDILIEDQRMRQYEYRNVTTGSANNLAQRYGYTHGRLAYSHDPSKVYSFSIKSPHNNLVNISRANSSRIINTAGNYITDLRVNDLIRSRIIPYGMTIPGQFRATRIVHYLGPNRVSESSAQQQI
jgi:hypothetical protein